MLSDLLVFDAQLAQISQTCNFYLCLFGYVVVFVYAFIYSTSKLEQLPIENVHKLPAELADLRRGTDEVVTQLYDEVARVRASNTDVIREIKEELNTLHGDDDKFVLELRDQFTQLSEQNQAAAKLVTALILRTQTLEAELAGLRQTIREVVTHLHDKVNRVQPANAQLQSKSQQ